MALHRALSMGHAVDGNIQRFGPDGGGKQQHFGPLKCQRPGGFGEPLIPADAAANAAMFGVNRAKTGITGLKLNFSSYPSDCGIWLLR